MGQQVNVTARIVNNGDADATHVRVEESGSVYTAGQWGDLGEQLGATVAAGATREVAVVGWFQSYSSEISLSLVVTSESGDLNPEDNRITLRATVTQPMARFGGTVFEDRNGNGAVDQGEGVNGAQITAMGGPSYTYLTVYTGFDGRFTFGDLAEGAYQVQYSHNSYTLYGVGGAQGQDSLTLAGDQYADVKIAAKPALSSVLSARLKFDATKYSAGDTATAKVILTNTGQRGLAGVTASCGSGQFEMNLGALAAGGAGVGVAAGATIAVPISGTVLAGATGVGYAALSCSFDATGYGPSSGPWISETVAVTGIPATSRGMLLDNTTYAAVPDVTVVLLDRETGESVARAVSGADGSFTVTDVSTGRYDVRLEGPWRTADSRLFEVTVDATWPTTIFAMPDESGQGRMANLKATVVMDKPAYESDEPVRTTLTISNIGNAAAVDVRMFTQPNSNFAPDGWSWGELDRGVTIEAGATRTFEFTGSANTWSGVPSSVIFSGRVWSSSHDSNFDNNEFFGMASWTAVYGDYRGLVYKDKNDNGKPDRGEGMDGVRVSASGGRPYGVAEVVTDSDGRFAIPHILRGDYVAYFGAEDEDWVIMGAGGDGTDRFTLTGAGRTVEMRAVPALRRTLTASLDIEKDQYGKDEIARASVTLTNRGTVALTGINAECGAHEGWMDTSEGWYPIGEPDPGTDLAPGQTKTFDVQNKISAEDYRTGYHSISCWFVADGHRSLGAPQAGDSAVVVGALGTRSGDLVHDANRDWYYSDDERLAGVTVQLIDVRTGKAVAQTVTDARGRFTFADRQAGRYRIHVVGPWASEHDDPWATQFPIWEGTSDYIPTFLLVPGPEQPPVGS